MVLQIGTASFGNNYGILNQNGLNDVDQIREIIKCCSKNNITLDSSPNYGSSLKLINSLSKDTEIKVNTKITIAKTSLLEFQRILEKHLISLKNCAVDTLYFHEPKASHHFQFRKYLQSAYEISKNFGIQNIGLSIYEKSDINPNNTDLNLINCIQIPFNILDNTNLIKQTNYKDITFVARSIYLQGLLTTSGINLLSNSPNKNDKKNAFLIRNLANKFNTKIEILSIAAVLMFKEIDKIILGVNSLDQFKEVLNFYKEAKDLSIVLSQNQNLLSEIDCDGSTFKRWLPILSNKSKLSDFENKL